MRKWRFLDTGFNDCYTNMAIDEALFIEFSSSPTVPVLRVYGWRPAAFSIGYFQKADEELDLDKCMKEGVPFVRRITGGRVIFHEYELTYSLTCRKGDIGANDRIEDSFCTTCGFLINAYKRLGLKAEFSLQKDLHQKAGSGFCFASRERYDIVIGGKKIGGNSQRRQRDIIFQHGSIPLKLDMERVSYFLKSRDLGIKERVVSLEDALGKVVYPDEIKAALKASFEEAFCAKLSEADMSPHERQLSIRLKAQKYLSSSWNISRYADRGKKAFVA